MDQNYNELIDWVLLKKKLTQPIPADQDLVESGVLDSLFFVEYVLMIEELSGIEVEVGADLLEKTRTLGLVKQHFFQASA